MHDIYCILVKTMMKRLFSRTYDCALFYLILQQLGTFLFASVTPQTRKSRDSSHMHDLISTCSLHRKTTGDGFHRDLRTEVELSVEYLTEVESADCHIILWEHLTAGVYVDLYQLETRHGFDGPRVLSSSDINVEKPEYLSTNHDLFVFPAHQTGRKGSSTLRTSVEMPIHLRYHRPSMNVQFVDVVLEHPKILLKCIDDAVMPPALNGISAPCEFTNTSLCDWSLLPCTNITPELSFKVPVGHQQDTVLVNVVTLAVSVLGGILLVYSAVCFHGQQNKFHRQ